MEKVSALIFYTSVCAYNGGLFPRSYPKQFQQLKGQTARARLCVVASRHLDDTLRHILVVPAVWPANVTHVMQHKKRQWEQLPMATRQLCLGLARLPVTLMPHLPTPIHIDDWQVCSQVWAG